MSDLEINDWVNNTITSVESQLKQQRYLFNIKALVISGKAQFPNVVGGIIKNKLDTAIENLIGPKTSQDFKNSLKRKNDFEIIIPEIRGAETTFLKPNENDLNTKEILERHLDITGGCVMTRFPPEPNGYLHIGHAKSISLNFGFAERDVSEKGKCFMRFDDTNPDNEKVEYMTSILKDVEWLGHTPYKITYSSDYFPLLYDLAIQLIKLGKAFVCHETREESKINREKGIDSKWRNRPISENLTEFTRMKDGCYAEGDATLRMKQDMTSDNFTMRDFVAYRIKYKSHPHVGDRWCIYPSYDYTHCIVDALENITNSFCTLEFAVRREPYYWLLDQLNLWKPQIWEYGRLSISNTVMSKRKLTKIVNEKNYTWDDPRLPTICGMRRRGYSANAINNFCNLIGVTRIDSTITDMNILTSCVRQDLDAAAPRRFAIMNPLSVFISNFDDFFSSENINVMLPNFPKNPKAGSRSISFTKTIYIEQSDFKMVDEPDFYGLAPNKQVLLKYGYIAHCKHVDFNKTDGLPLLVYVVLEKTNSSKPKGTIHWLPNDNQIIKNVELRLYNQLFNSRDPSALLDNWIDDINPNSVQIVKGAMVESSLGNCKKLDTFQFERLGFFCLDYDSSNVLNNRDTSHLIFNRTITLKK